LTDLVSTKFSASANRFIGLALGRASYRIRHVSSECRIEAQTPTPLAFFVAPPGLFFRLVLSVRAVTLRCVKGIDKPCSAKDQTKERQGPAGRRDSDTTGTARSVR